jgi:hypothetical protein
LTSGLDLGASHGGCWRAVDAILLWTESMKKLDRCVLRWFRVLEVIIGVRLFDAIIGARLFEVVVFVRAFE